MGTDDQAGDSGTVMVNLKATATSISEFVCINWGKKEAKEAKEREGEEREDALTSGNHFSFTFSNEAGEVTEKQTRTTSV